MIDKNDKNVKRSLEIVHEGINFDFCRRITLNEIGDGLYKLKMEAFIMPKKQNRNDY